MPVVFDKRAWGESRTENCYCEDPGTTPFRGHKEIGWEIILGGVALYKVHNV